jgi:hypothetical protein
MNDATPRQLSWVHPNVAVRSKGTGFSGSFATAPIPKGTVVMVQGGRILPSDVLDTPEYEQYWYHSFQVERDVYIAPLLPERAYLDAIFLVNHSCDPTCGMAGQISLITIRDVAAGEEVTFDYAMTDTDIPEEQWEPMTCQCGQANCRKIITGDDWKDPSLQARYRGYFAPYVARLIAAQST